MPNMTELFNAGAGNAFVFAPTAIALGALHGLEPGHSKTMMAAFIVAVRGTVTQAILLGLSATLSHSAIVWIIALSGMYFGAQWAGEGGEAWLQIASGVLILGVAGWMAFTTFRAGRRAHDHDHAGHDHHDHDHGHHHHDHDDHHHHHGHDHSHDHGHDHDHAPAPADAAFERELTLIDPADAADEHERQHALDINRRFAGRKVTTAQIVLFGLTGGLIPCPASITVLLLCLQAGRIGLGVALVLCFSIGLALTLTLTGVVAALGLRHAASRWPGLETLAARAPYFSGALIAVVGVYTLWSGYSALHAA